MRQTDKKELKALLIKLCTLKDEFETFKDAHEEWMDERDYETDGRFSETATGERAQEEHDQFDEWFNTLQYLADEIEETL